MVACQFMNGIIQPGEKVKFITDCIGWALFSPCLRTSLSSLAFSRVSYFNWKGLELPVEKPFVFGSLVIAQQGTGPNL